MDAIHPRTVCDEVVADLLRVAKDMMARHGHTRHCAAVMTRYRDGRHCALEHAHA